MPKVFTSEKQKVGQAGENIAARFLVKRGFQIIERNYTKKWGELDIVAEKEGKLYFIEVKSVSCENLEYSLKAYRPEENMHPWKLKRLSRAIQTYLLSHKNYSEKEWQLDLLVVFLNLKDKKARVRVVDNIIL